MNAAIKRLCVEIFLNDKEPVDAAGVIYEQLGVRIVMTYSMVDPWKNEWGNFVSVSDAGIAESGKKLQE